MNGTSARCRPAVGEDSDAERTSAHSTNRQGRQWRRRKQRAGRGKTATGAGPECRYYWGYSSRCPKRGPISKPHGSTSVTQKSARRLTAISAPPTRLVPMSRKAPICWRSVPRIVLGQHQFQGRPARTMNQAAAILADTLPDHVFHGRLSEPRPSHRTPTCAAGASRIFPFGCATAPAWWVRWSSQGRRAA